MTWLDRQMRWIMVVSGVLTLSMLYATIAPEAALTSNFGSSLSGPVAEIVVRNWGALIGLVGAMLLYGAYDASARRLVLTVAAVSKLTFIALVLTFGRELLQYQVRIAVVVDAFWVLVFSAYLLPRSAKVRNSAVATLVVMVAAAAASAARM